MSAVDAAATPPAHPRGLYVLFAAEAWERFSFYGMRALLVLYLTKHLHYARQDALTVYGVYTGLVYVTPIVGGYLADKVLGKRKAVVIGGAIMAVGHLAMASEPLLHLALGLIIVGNGFFKPNISTMVGGLYEQGDPRRDGGFTIFYMGINLGAFVAPLVCGTLGEKVGWDYGFGAAGVGMIFGLGVFTAGQRFLGNVGLPPKRGLVERPPRMHHEIVEERVVHTGRSAPAPAHAPRLDARDWRDIGVWVVAACALVVGVVEAAPFLWSWWIPLHGALKVVLGVGLVAAAARPWRSKRGGAATTGADKAPFTRDEWERIVVIGVVLFFVVFFWMGFEQAGGTMTLFADKQTNRHVLFGDTAWEIPASYFQSINALGIIVFAPALSRVWLKIDQTRWRLSSPIKMAFGMIVLGLGFVVLYVGQQRALREGTVGPGWLVAVYLCHTFGELMLSPIGLSLITKLSPARIVSLMMGLWFASAGVANYLAGTLEGMLSRFHVPVYGFLIASSIGAGVVLLALAGRLEKGMHGRG